MKKINLTFQIHQPFRLKRYRFFDIGTDNYYYDDFNNESIISRIAEDSYKPALQLFKEMIETSGKKFKVSFAISGLALEQFEIYTPEIIDQLRELVNTGCVEFLAEPYAHSLASLVESEDLTKQITKHCEKIAELFGIQPKIFRNTELLYSDDISCQIANLGFEGTYIEGAKHILGWKSPNYLYHAATNPNLKLVVRNAKLSDDITFRFSDTSWSDYPLTADKFIYWITSQPHEERFVNLFLNLETLGNIQKESTGIFEFFKALPTVAEQQGIGFALPTEILAENHSVDSISAPHSFSWADEDKGTSSWLGNRLQQEAFDSLYKVAPLIHISTNRRLRQDWMYLQASDHFYYMTTKHGAFRPFESPVEAFTNYMNVLADFKGRLEAEFPTGVEIEELNSLTQTIHNQAIEIEELKKQLCNAPTESASKAPTPKSAVKKAETKSKPSKMVKE